MFPVCGTPLLNCVACPLEVERGFCGLDRELVSPNPVSIIDSRSLIALYTPLEFIARPGVDKSFHTGGRWMNKTYRCGYCNTILKEGRRYYCNDYCLEHLAGSQRIDESFLFITDYEDLITPIRTEPHPVGLMVMQPAAIQMQQK